MLNAVCRLLGVAPDDLVQALTMCTSHVRREAYNVFLDAGLPRAQRDRLAMDLYAALFAFVTELANHMTEPVAEQRFTQVVLLDQPGPRSRRVEQRNAISAARPEWLLRRACSVTRLCARV